MINKLLSLHLFGCLYYLYNCYIHQVFTVSIILPEDDRLIVETC